MDRSKAILSASALALYVHFALQLVAGGALATAYGPERGHAATAALHQGGWAVVQGFHYWGSAVMIVHSVLHLAAVTWAGGYREPRARGYWAALVLAGLSFAFQLTGNLLPVDRHGVQTAAIEGSIAARVPGVGPTVSRLMLGGDEASVRTVALWYDLHRIGLPILLALALGLAWGAIRKEDARWPIVLPALGALALALAVASPFGTAAGTGDYSAYSAKPSWYTAPMHGLLVWGGWLGAMAFPAIVGLGLALLPALKPREGVVRGGLAVLGGILLVAAGVSGGESAPLVGTRDPAALVVAKPLVGAAAKKDPARAAAGKALFAAQGCNGCHGQDGLKGGGGGPSLANVWKAHADADYYVRYIRDPKSVEKGSTMPAYGNLKKEELLALAEFLRFARS